MNKRLHQIAGYVHVPTMAYAMLFCTHLLVPHGLQPVTVLAYALLAVHHVFAPRHR